MTLGRASAARAEEEPWLQSWQSIAKDLLDVASPGEREIFEFIDDVVPESEDYFAFLRPHVASLETVGWVAAFAAFDQLDDALTMQFVRDAVHSGDKRAADYLARRLMPMQIRRE